MFVTNWNSTTKIQKISEITNFFRHYFLSRTEVVLIRKRTIICLSMFFHCLTKQGLLGDTHIQIIYAFPPKVRLCVFILHPASVAPFKQADYYGTSYDDDNRYAKSHRLRNLCFIYRRRNRNPWINNKPRISILCQFNEFLIFH